MVAPYPGQLTTPMPTMAGFVAWVRQAMRIPPDLLPDNSIWLGYAYDAALAITYAPLATVPGPIYMLAVYNLGGSNLINFAQDEPGAPDVPGSSPPAPLFQWLRQQYGTASFVPGVIQSSSDESTSQSFLVLEFMNKLTLADLQYLKDPYGRQYLAFAQQWGCVWGIS